MEHMSDLIPVEQKQIEFQGGEITAVMVQDENGRENVYIPLKPLVEGMGLNWSGQRQRIMKNPVLRDVCRSVGVTHTEPNRTRNIEMLCIPINHLNGFLFGVNANRVKSEIRPLVLDYQEKCYEVLFNAFNGTESMRRFYSAMGYDAKWIKARIEKHNYGQKLTDVWLLYGVPVEKHSQLEDIINKGIFGLTIADHKTFKRVPETEQLHDHMTGAELLISALADEAAYESTLNDNPQTFDEHRQIAEESGKTGSKIRQVFEEQTKRPVLSDKNHLDKKHPSLKDQNKAEE